VLTREKSIQKLAAACLLLFLAAPVESSAQDWGAQDAALDDLSRIDEAITEPIEQINVAAADMGIVSAIHVELGDRVQAGQLMIEMDMSVLEASRRVAESKANSTARLKAAEVEYNIKRVRYEKLVELVKEGAGSPEEVERARADTEVALRNVEAILEDTNHFQLEVQQYEAQIERRRIRSPIDGQVVEIKKRLGEYVSTNDPHLVTVVQLDTLRAIFYVSTARARQFQKNDVVEIDLNETGQRAAGSIDYVAPITEGDSGRVRVDVLINNGTGEFRSGVRCRLVGKIEQRTSLEIPLKR
jgi:RND family efflux transporter MFP subunit